MTPSFAKHKNWFASLAPLAIAASALAVAPAAQAAPRPADLVPGEVVAVTGTDNLWVADSQGMVHFVGDPRALANRPVDWSDRLDVPFDQLAALPHGNPWLSTPLVKIGEQIFLPQWNGNGNTPVLRHVASPSDLAQLGVDASNYGEFVIDLPAWEQRFNLSLDRVQFDGDLMLTPPAPAPEAVPDTSSDNSNNAADTSAPAITNESES